MEFLLEYHLVFIGMAFILLLFTIALLVVDNTKEKTFFAMILAGFNYLLCLLNSLGFFSIGIIGYRPDGTIVINANHDMFSFYTIFFLLHLFNVALIIYCYWMWVRDPWNIGEPGSSEIQSKQTYRI
jgi:hypothetical protein